MLNIPLQVQLSVELRCSTFQCPALVKLVSMEVFKGHDFLQYIYFFHFCKITI